MQVGEAVGFWLKVRLTFGRSLLLQTGWGILEKSLEAESSNLSYSTTKLKPVSLLMRQLQPSSSGLPFWGVPRRILLRWVSVYFMLFSLILVIGGSILLGDGDGALAGIGSPAVALAILVGLVNFGLGLVGLLLSFWPRPKTASRTANGAELGPIELKHGLLGWLYPATVGLVSALLLYGLGTVAGLAAVLFVVQNWASGWYGWRMPQVKLGDSRQQVEERVGRGSFSADCDSSYARDYSRSTDLSRCASVTLYYEYSRVGWEIGYDAAGRVVSKQRVKP